jgi:type VI secretion system FHA domain protein
VILILELTSPQSMKPAGASRQSFSRDGGSIGRDTDNTWVLPHSKISGHHALISFRGAAFYIEDTSRNGVFLNTSKNRLVRGQPYPLKTGDRILIDPYEISVSIEGDDRPAPPRRRDAVAPAPARDPFFDPSDPFGGQDPFASGPAESPLLEADAPVDSLAPEELDPLELLNLGGKPPPPRKAPNARDLDRGSPLDAHFRPPSVIRPPAPPQPSAPLDDPLAIPQDYDPLAPDEPPAPVAAPPPRRVVARVPPPPADETLAPPPVRPAPGRHKPPPPPEPLEPVHEEPPDLPEPERVNSPQPVRVTRPDPVRTTPPVEAAVDRSSHAALAGVLQGAGLDPADITPELAQTFGQILRVVVTGVMDVLRSRQQIKDEFRMRMTRFRSAENNPLKFSANVDDALHNLLVKRNAAYLGPVDAFEDAFADLRKHQIAMLAGMRVAFEAMLKEFDPDRLQAEFDRQLSKGLVPAKLRYWELFRERRDEIVRDPEASFRRLFGEEFARAYEEQLKQLK